MKQVLALTLLLMVAFSCKKGTDSEKKPEPVPNFSITGLRDVDFRSLPGSSFTFPITITSTPGNVDTVFLYANELPGGVYVDFDPINGITPLTSKVRVSFYGTAPGTYTIKINCTGRTGKRSYDLNVTTPEFRGWKLAGEFYHNTTVERDPGNGIKNPKITVNAQGGSQLIFMFAPGAALPSSERTCTIANVPTGESMAIILNAPGHSWRSTGGSTNGGSATGRFTFDSSGKFTFNCSNILMADSTGQQTLDCSFSE